MVHDSFTCLKKAITCRLKQNQHREFNTIDLHIYMPYFYPLMFITRTVIALEAVSSSEGGGA